LKLEMRRYIVRFSQLAWESLGGALAGVFGSEANSTLILGNVVICGSAGALVDVLDRGSGPEAVFLLSLEPVLSVAAVCRAMCSSIVDLGRERVGDS